MEKFKRLKRINANNRYLCQGCIEWFEGSDMYYREVKDHKHYSWLCKYCVEVKNV